MKNHCDGCTECCYYLGIEELHKAPCATCTHVDEGKGCKVYIARPNECRDFECVWLQAQRLPHPWPRKMRPDKSGVMFAQTTDINTLSAHCRSEVAFSAPPARWFINRMLGNGIRIVRVIGQRRTLVHWVKANTSLPRGSGDAAASSGEVPERDGTASNPPFTNGVQSA